MRFLNNKQTLALAALTFASSLSAETLPIQNVLLYPDRAQVTRKARLPLQQGKNRILIQNVTPMLMAESLRASCAPECTIVEVSSRVDRFAETQRPRILQLEQKLSAANERKEGVASAVSRNQYILAFTGQLAVALGKVIGEETMRPADPSRWTRAADFISAEKAARRRTVQRLDEDLRKIDLEIQQIEKELAQARSDAEKTSRTIEVRLNSPKAQQADLSVAYNVTGASWSISYGATHARDGSVDVEMYGEAVQGTGEDWKNVLIGFSTANTRRGLDRPRIQPIRFRIIDRRPDRVYRNEEREAAGEVTEAAPTDSAQTGGITNVEAGETALVFRVPEPQTVESSRKPQRIPLARFQLKPLETVYRVVPSLAENAVLALKLKNDRVFPLLPGPVDLFRAGRFTGRTRLGYVPGSAEFSLGFAEERNIRVQRNIIRNRGSAGILGSGKLLTREIQFEAQNRGQTEAAVQIMESLPISELEEVVITVTDAAGFKEEKPGTGIYSRRLTLPPGAKVEFTIKYSVKAPQDFPENLLDR